MRFILGLGLVLGLMWGGYWFVGARAVEQGAAAWFADSTAQGFTASHEGIGVQGFPSRFDLTVTAPRLADPATGIGWTAPFAQIFAMTWKPWHVIAVLPHDQQIYLADGPVSVTSARMAASLRLSPDSDLTFRELVIETHDLSLTSDRGWTLGLAQAVAAMAQAADDPRDYRLGIEASDLRPDPALVEALPDLGNVISRLHLDATLQMTATLDRNMSAVQPQPAGLVLHALRLDWGALHLLGSGQLQPGPDGLATGEILFDITGWRQIPLLAVEMGWLQPEMAKGLEDGLEAMAAANGDVKSLTLPLRAEAGWLSLGPLPLGPAPFLVQRQ